MYTAPRLHSSQYTHIWSATQPCRQSNLILQQTKYLEYSTHLVRRHSVASNHKGSTPPTKAMSDVSAKQRNDEPYDVKEEAQLLTEFAEIPGISSALIGPATSEGQQITVQYVQRNIPANKIRKFLRSFHVPENIKGSVHVAPSLPIELRDVLLQSPSPSGQQQLVVRTGKEGEGIMMEIWRGSRIVKEVHVPKDLHGSVYNDNWFCKEAAWNPKETHISYVAEVAIPPSTPMWGQEPSGDDSKADKEDSKSDKAKAGPKGWRGVGQFQEDWGELNTGKKTPGLFVLDIARGSVSAVTGLPEDSSSGQPVWTPDGSGLVFVSWPHKSLNFPQLTQRLGIVFCVNRPCFLYHISIAGEATSDSAAPVTKIETGLQSALSPAFSPDGQYLYFVAHNNAVTTGVHHGAMTLERVAWPSKGARETIIDVIGTPASKEDFPGLFGVPFKCITYGFVSSNRILMTSQWRSSTQVLDVELAEGGGVSKISRSMNMSAAAPSSLLLAVQHGKAAALFTGPRHPPTLALASLSSGPLKWEAVQTAEASFSSQITAFLESEAPVFHTLQVTPTTAPKTEQFEAVLLMNGKGDKKAPTVLVPHGGPHSAYPTVYLLSNAYLTALGYNVLQVNYRGSLGFGEDALQSLPGNIGTNDVADCIAALDLAVAEGYVDNEKVVVMGGSHGGFLTGHLLGQHHDRFKAGVLRNPVLDLALMNQISDIPDWCFVEGYGSQEGLKRASIKPSPEEQQHFTKMSPISHIAKIRAPMFFMLGAKDRRVVMQDAQQYVAALKAQPEQVENRVIVFPNDTHALDQPQTEFEQLINAAWWFKRFI